MGYYWHNRRVEEMNRSSTPRANEDVKRDGEAHFTLFNSMDDVDYALHDKYTPKCYNKLRLVCL